MLSNKAPCILQARILNAAVSVDILHRTLVFDTQYSMKSQRAK